MKWGKITQNLKNPVFFMNFYMQNSKNVVTYYYCQIIEEGEVMFTKKINKKIFIIHTVIIYTVSLLFTTYYFSNPIKSNENTKREHSEGLQSIPQSLHYSWFQSIVSCLPEEEIKTASYIDFFSGYSKNMKHLIHNILDTVFSLVNGLQIYIFLLLTLFRKQLNTEKTNSIPLGGHAPPEVCYY